MMRFLSRLCRALPLVAVVVGLTASAANAGITGRLLITNNLADTVIKVFINDKEVGTVPAQESAVFKVNAAADARTKLDVRTESQSWEDSVTEPNKANGDHLWVINPK